MPFTVSEIKTKSSAYACALIHVLLIWKPLILSFSRVFNNGSIHKLKAKGENGQPCLTPQFICIVSDVPFCGTKIFVDVSLYVALIRLIKSGLKPYCFKDSNICA